MGSSARDVVIVGGGPAGLTAAVALGRAAPELRARVVVLEAGTYPRDKYCAGALGGRGDKILADLGACPRVPSVPFDGISLRANGAGEVSARVGGIGRVVRRIEFDHALAELAKKQGVEIQEATRVLSVEEREGKVILETSRGPIEAAVVVGADGVGSAVRKAMGLSRGALRAQVIEVDTEPVEGDRDRTLIHFDASDRRYTGYTWDFPTVVGGEELVCRGIYVLRMSDEEVSLQAFFTERLAAMGLDLATYKNKRFAERGYEPAVVLARGPLMLVGEAAGIDPVTGEGIAQAIEYGAMAGRFLVDVLGRGRPVEAWTTVVRESRLARDLAVRTRAVNAFYGPLRPRVERFLVGCKSAIHVGGQHFAGQRIDRGRLAEVVLRGGMMLLAGTAAGLRL